MPKNALLVEVSNISPKPSTTLPRLSLDFAERRIHSEIMNESSFTFARLDAIREHTIAQIREVVGNQNVVVSHVTALRVLRVEVPRECSLKSNAVHIMSMVKGKRRANRQIVTHSCNRELPVVQVDERIWCVAPAYVWVHMAGYVSIEDLVVLGDAMMRRDRELKLLQIDDFTEALALLGQHYRHGATCRSALRMLRADTDSPPESALRVGLWRIGLGGMVVNHVVEDTEHIWMPDLAWVESKVALEYEGEYHFGRHQVQHDAHRNQRFRQLGWSVINAYAEDLIYLDCNSRIVSAIVFELERASGRQVVLHPRMSDQELLRTREVDMLTLKRRYRKQTSTRWGYKA